MPDQTVPTLFITDTHSLFDDERFGPKYVHVRDQNQRFVGMASFDAIARILEAHGFEIVPKSPKPNFDELTA
jgi:hypothetical protein